MLRMKKDGLFTHALTANNEGGEEVNVKFQLAKSLRVS